MTVHFGRWSFHGQEAEIAKALRTAKYGELASLSERFHVSRQLLSRYRLEVLGLPPFSKAEQSKYLVKLNAGIVPSRPGRKPRGRKAEFFRGEEIGRLQKAADPSPDRATLMQRAKAGDKGAAEILRVKYGFRYVPVPKETSGGDSTPTQA